MFNNVKKIQDAFTFALAGMSGVNTYIPVPIAANNIINEAWDEHFSQSESLVYARQNARLGCDTAYICIPTVGEL